MILFFVVYLCVSLRQNVERSAAENHYLGNEGSATDFSLAVGVNVVSVVFYRVIFFLIHSCNGCHSKR